MTGYLKNTLTPLKAFDVSNCCKAVFDIETIGTYQHQRDDNQELNGYALGFYDGHKYEEFIGHDCIEQFLKFFLTPDNAGVISYAHNGGKFDFSFILQKLVDKKNIFYDKYVITPIRTASRIIQITIKKKNKGNDKTVYSWILRDSMGLFVTSLKKLTNNFDVKTKKGDFKHEKVNWNNYMDYYSEWSPYLKADCVGLFECLEKFEDRILKLFNINLERNITLAQLCMNIFRRQFLDINIPNYPSIEDDIRSSYYGGRTEIFKMFGKDLKYYDVTSLYPAVMEKKKFPVGKPIKDPFLNIHTDLGICHCEVECPKDLDIPLLPFKKKTKTGTKLIFPVGKFKGWYCTPEIIKAKNLGYKIKILDGYKFKEHDLFSGYVKEMFKLKASAKKGSLDYILAKLLMNSLYGKFGQRRDREKLVIFPKSTIGYEPVDFYGDLPVFSKKTESRANHILPAISSFVTSYARVHLYENCIEATQKAGGNIYYCDTDSIITDIELKTDNLLGGLTDEVNAPIEQGIFLLPKMYGLKLGVKPEQMFNFKLKSKEYIKCKGFPRGLFNFDMYEKGLKGDYTQFNYSKTSIATPFESMRRNKSFVSTLKKTRRVINRYDKRVVLQNYNTKPLVLNEI